MKIGAAKILLSCFLLFAVFGIALADLTNPLGTCDLSCLAGKITKFLFIISIPIVSIMVLVGGFQMMTAGGNPEKFSSGKKTILYAAIGFVVVLLADQVPKILKNLFGP
ncbi:MAG: hypothetical protein A2945_01855 [Candidatus Liptonbacteria bacterium RIFCSPLOWO2_01_FULL_52_25]|uniref:Conjugal transfer protein TrbC n=1 Tax=Candidatus Liptonbacteria bacterium RIFCSPLOWO2_01_FULL_52_25 TaxID=1798650 RepID=A0A1G2CEB8_9BACT|nr:MAG: hypothetical protein A2945_01855 [Candidatus Liptonbacteria bacterium RIFCSPLOWO2_01_FULL_52_25]